MSASTPNRPRSESPYAQRTELPVLLRNPRIDVMTRELLQYYRRCIQEKRSNIGVSFIPG